MWLQSIIGISVVFLALIALSFSIYLFGKLMNSKKNTNTVNQKNISIEVDGDDQLIAVITAAISAYLNSNGIDPECKIRVKSFNRITSTTSIWNEVSKIDLIENI